MRRNGAKWKRPRAKFPYGARRGIIGLVRFRKGNFFIAIFALRGALFCFLPAIFPCDVVVLNWSKSNKSDTPLFRIVMNGRAGYIDPNGKIIIRPQFDPAGNWGGDFFDGLANVMARKASLFYRCDREAREACG